MFRRILWLLPILLMGVYAFSGQWSGDYDDGYDQAIRDLQETRARLGWASEMGGAIIDRIDHLPGNPDQSSQWNDGYRQAILDQWESTTR